MNVVKININVAGRDKCFTGNQAGQEGRSRVTCLCFSLSVHPLPAITATVFLVTATVPLSRFAQLRACHCEAVDKIPVPTGGATDCAELAVPRSVVETGAAGLLNGQEREAKAAAEGWGSWKLWDVTRSEHNCLHHKCFSWSAA